MRGPELHAVDEVDVLSGSGGNMPVLNGTDGTLLVDAGVDTSQRQIREALAKTGREPIRHLVNTDWHFDHTGGNEWLHAAGATILAHANTRKHLSAATRVEAWDFTFPPVAAGAVPEVIVNPRHVVAVNGETIVLEPYNPCHTDSDISVRFTEADVFQTGDTWWNGQYPFIEYSTGGSITGAIAAPPMPMSPPSARELLRSPATDPVSSMRVRDSPAKDGSENEFFSDRGGYREHQQRQAFATWLIGRRPSAASPSAAGCTGGSHRHFACRTRGHTWR